MCISPFDSFMIALSWTGFTIIVCIIVASLFKKQGK